jgi:glucosamine--fructose-6-phosphate aminotransferase (isomerizing)
VELDRELEQLPDLAQRLIERYSPAIQGFANEGKFDQYACLGQGPYFGLASELMLKIKEIARTPAEVYHSLEYLHGPRFAATPSTLIIVLLSDGGLKQQLDLLPKLKATGAQVAVVCERSTPEVADNANFVMELNSGLSDYGRLLLVMPLVQLFSYYRALALGQAAWIEEMVRFPAQVSKS